jgi:hypothetical protein
MLVPSNPQTATIAPTTISGDRPRCVMTARKSTGNEVKLMKLENLIAAIGMKNSIAVVRALSTSTCNNTGGGDDRRAANGATPVTGQQRDRRQAVAKVPDEGRGGAEPLVRQPGTRHEVAHQDEQRHDRQGVGKTSGIDDSIRG